MKLINNAHQWWKFWSVRISLLGLALPQVWMGLGQDQREAVLDLIGLRGITAAVSLFFALIVAARLLQQNLDQQK
jgi:hypothetical protein